MGSIPSIPCFAFARVQACAHTHTREGACVCVRGRAHYPTIQVWKVWKDDREAEFARGHADDR